jgi:hypothetical protein
MLYKRPEIICLKISTKLTKGPIPLINQEKRWQESILTAQGFTNTINNSKDLGINKLKLITKIIRAEITTILTEKKILRNNNFLMKPFDIIITNINSQITALLKNMNHLLKNKSIKNRINWITNYFLSIANLLSSKLISHPNSTPLQEKSPSKITSNLKKINSINRSRINQNKSTLTQTRPNINAKISRDSGIILPNPQISLRMYLKAHTQDKADPDPVQNPAQKPHNIYQFAKKVLQVFITTPPPNRPSLYSVSNFQLTKSSSFGLANVQE